MVGLRELGKTKVKLNPLGLGCMGMCDGVYGAADDEESTRTLNRALELGCTFWDTADMYGVGQNERFLSETVKKNRDKVFICTKFGNVRDPETGAFLRVDGTPEYVRKACDASLKRLGIDTIDLYYQHRVDKNTPIEETVKAMAELVKEGKVRYLGLSECSAETLRRAYKVHPIAAVQIEYSPWYLGIEQNGLLNAARELGVSIVAYSPLGRGFLTGAVKSLDDLPKDDYRRQAPRFFPENFQKNLDLVKRIEELAAKKGVTPSEYVLAWVLAQGEDFFVIPGTKKVKYLEKNVNGGKLDLTKEEEAEMRAAIEAAAPQGDRYAAHFMASVEDR
ncbi:pyridoxine 4-dehydrogenase [Zychaea mexicana]|uniref:pyridoxine 4-dehydrogenase n=1 Tax=Zychaea mexicana TaxID=64656 RepID=UPI0022FE3365|nr:pyridoxine 4-dehydrogenase [Zychaea mexicana]KAI9488406.1 pyridoxine 4-dehydrogenase [Zychaea mexicana]